jgi:biopolymer transport protein ExbD
MSIQVGGKTGSSGMDEINVTPLIDVVLVLLIIFMVLTPITVQKMASNLPPPDTDEPPPPPDPNNEQLMVAVYDDGSLALNLVAETDDALRRDVALRLRSKEKKTVFIDADPDANYGRVVQVMDMVRESGAEHVGLAELKDEGPARLEPGAVLPGTAVPGGPSGAAAGAPTAVPTAAVPAGKPPTAH